MNYQETWDIAHAIGYHRGRMVVARNTTAVKADILAFDAFLQRVKPEWQNTAVRAHDQGITEGNV